MYARTPSRQAAVGDPNGDPDGDPGTLVTLGLFAGLPRREIDEIAARCTVSTAHPGQVIQAQDVPVRMWHVVTAGHAVVRRDDRPIGLLGRGASWSEHSLFNGLPSSIAVVALSPLMLLTLNQREFFEIPDRHPVLAGRLVARSACSADRLALPALNALANSADTDCTGGCPAGQYD
jgi:CRP-like cAMP-binding protein